MAKPLLEDDLWAALELLLPPEPPRPKGGRRRVPNKAALRGILFVLRAGLPWELLPKEMGCGSGMTCWRRLKEWQEAGVWKRIHNELLGWLGEKGQIDWSRAALDSASVPAKRGANLPARTRRTAANRAGKRHVVVERKGIPLAAKLSGANQNDCTFLEEMIDAIPAIRRPRGRSRRRPGKLHADKAYDHRRCRRFLRRRGIQARIARPPGR